MWGWGDNLGRDLMNRKAVLLTTIQAIDARANSVEPDPEEWMERYTLEDDLMSLFQNKEIYCRLRDRLNWTLHGDSNITYF